MAKKGVDITSSEMFFHGVCEIKWYPLVSIQKTVENHHFEWVNQLFLWPFSIAMLNYQRVCFFELQKQPNLKPW